MIWALASALVVALLSFVGAELGWTTLLSGVMEMAAVVALFALVCAAEAWN